MVASCFTKYYKVKGWECGGGVASKQDKKGQGVETL